MGQKSNFLFLCPQIVNKSYYKNSRRGVYFKSSCEISSQPLPRLGNTAEVFLLHNRIVLGAHEWMVCVTFS